MMRLAVAGKSLMRGGVLGGSVPALETPKWCELPLDYRTYVRLYLTSQSRDDHLRRGAARAPMSQSIAELRTALERRGHAVIIGGERTDAGARPFQGHASRGFSIGADLDAILEPAGIPRGRLTEVFGGPSSGKTSVAFASLAACTSTGLLGAYVDPVGAFFAPAAAGA